jgi:hypothetical protein
MSYFPILFRNQSPVNALPFEMFELYAIIHHHTPALK